MVEPEEEEEEDEVERLERKILEKRKLITRLLRLRMKTRTFHNSFRVVMNFH